MNTMALLKYCIVLIAVLIIVLLALAVMTGFPLGEPESPDPSEHHIPPEYWANASPATPIPESEMITIILAESTLSAPGQDTPTGIVEIPLSRLNLSSRFMKSDEYENWYLETDLDTGKSVVLIRMPQTVYERHIAMSKNATVSLPETSFCRIYQNLSDLNAHIQRDGEGVRVLPDYGGRE
ncbi:hypothetical protein [Methanogenium organophilum]|uniref:Uncharacterized protein n=1 Tax=Methanogenium organophilum TaxID=2199 RepID=A0A9X9S3G2_METOG|nr:hypothetical protein [Methanogenium organophilum]WAI01083.1 hypothetical protein OU421_11775 [Methanogenium organophilum]